MIWIVAGLVYATAYAIAVSLLAGAPAARLWVGNLGLLLSPLAPLIVILRRRDHWRGRQLVFFDAIAVGAALWLGGQIAWAAYELLLGYAQPWLNWDVVPQLCGSAMPLLALIAAPHRGQRRYTAATAALDIYGVMFLLGFLCWTVAIAPGLAPGREQLGLKMVVYLGPAIRAAALLALISAAYVARESPWLAVYSRLAIGIGLSLMFLLSVSAHVFAGSYLTGSPADIGWILPFWFFAGAAADAPPSEAEPRPLIVQRDRPGPPLILFGAILVVPIAMLIVREFMPLGGPADRYREMGEDLAILGGIALAIVRVSIEQRVARRYERRVRLLATACEQTSELIVIAHGERIEYANAAFCRALGYTLPEITALDRRVLLAGDVDSDRTLARLADGEPVHGDLVLKRRDGTTFPAAVAAAPLEAVDRTGSYFVAVVRDMSDDLRIREQLVRTERLSAIGELVSSIAQQINNPLQSVVGTVDVLLSDPAATPVRPDLERVRLEAWRAGHTIRNLLAFARKAPTERILGELNDVVEAALALCAYDLKASHVRVVDQLARNLPLVLVNREELQQAVVNLITNARHSFSRQRREGTLTVRTYLRGRDAVLEIADDGPGLPPEVASRIFEPFVTTTAMGEADGFGLSTAFGIVTAHGGTLELVPVPAGACFRMTLPGAGFAGPVVRSA